MKASRESERKNRERGREREREKKKNRIKSITGKLYKDNKIKIDE